jgi:hypothetical protein
MIRPGNSKLGPLLHHWSIPSAVAAICVGATLLCLKLCYATKHHYCRPNVQKALEQNWEYSKRDDFVSLALAWITSLFVRVLRVHASGEFYDEQYVRKWIEIVKATPRVTYFAYTRSWRKPELVEALKELAKLPNVVLWWSCDRESGPPPVVKGVRRAYLMADNDDVPEYKVDLIFRHKTSKVLKWVKDTLVCPAENGITRMTCSKCQLCFNQKPIPRKKKIHGHAKMSQRCNDYRQGQRR